MNSIISSIQEVVRERNFHQDDVFFAIEHVLLKLAKERYGNEDLTVKVDRETGDITLHHNREVVQSNSSGYGQIDLVDAKLISDKAKVGDTIQKVLDFGDFDRISTKTSINALYEKLEELRRIREFAEFEHRAGQIVSCIVKQTFYDGQLIVTVEGRGIGVLKKEDRIPTELTAYKPGDPIEAYVKYVSQTGAHQIVLSRTAPEFLGKLMQQHVPELLSGEIIIKSIARRPGKRAKVAVYTENTSIDPIRLCVGQEGSRIKPVVNELKGERIDIILWDENPVAFAVKALKPGEAKQAIYRSSGGEEEARNNNIILIVDDEQKKKAIGEAGINVKLASELTHANISVLTVTEADQRKQELQKFFEVVLDVDSDISELLVDSGFETIRDLHNASIEEISTATEMDTDLVEVIKDRAKDYSTKTSEYLQNFKHKALLKVPGLKTPYLQILVQHELTDFAKLAEETPEHLQQLLSNFAVTELSVKRFIAYAKRELLREPLAGQRYFGNRERSDRGTRAFERRPSPGGSFNRDRSTSGQSGSYGRRSSSANS